MPLISLYVLVLLLSIVLGFDPWKSMVIVSSFASVVLYVKLQRSNAIKGIEPTFSRTYDKFGRLIETEFYQRTGENSLLVSVWKYNGWDSELYAKHLYTSTEEKRNDEHELNEKIVFGDYYPSPSEVKVDVRGGYVLKKSNALRPHLKERFSEKIKRRIKR